MMGVWLHTRKQRKLRRAHHIPGELAPVQGRFGFALAPGHNILLPRGLVLAQSSTMPHCLLMVTEVGATQFEASLQRTVAGKLTSGQARAQVRGRPPMCSLRFPLRNHKALSLLNRRRATARKHILTPISSSHVITGSSWLTFGYSFPSFHLLTEV